jgi:hypothetical protein
MVEHVFNRSHDGNSFETEQIMRVVRGAHCESRSR